MGLESSFSLSLVYNVLVFSAYDTEWYHQIPCSTTKREGGRRQREREEEIEKKGTQMEGKRRRIGSYLFFFKLVIGTDFRCGNQGFENLSTVSS